MKKGKLVRVEIGPGRFVKMYESDVKNSKLAASPENKLAASPENKLAAPSENKVTIEPGSDDPVVFDELSSIPGVGKASERSLNEHGIFTFAQLAAVDELPYLNAKVNESIAEWRLIWSG